ncbi:MULTISPECIES: Holliday junction resolvase RuvX [Halomonadaceae]|uniref:Putative pre-16S rRNA nuclease n=1 Tax=Vreelandella halophila TaxID=86177 RepID=A0A9X4YAP5_9GAMM|nr:MULTISPECIES: Holliday junction resolvase RuvX [Halomonas]MYL25981.1 Holliday junction resolvase RuvX [Halomonas utahensis]MYL73457.1 Holliday junction resolvase RuvX [Halomonas sp. 22501_18_FS]
MPESRSLMAFDFGEKWIGVAVGQEMLGYGSGKARLKARDGIPDWNQVAELVEDWQPDLFLVGLPLNMDGTETWLCHLARKFARRLEGRYHRPATMVDERLTTHEAKQESLAQGRVPDHADEGVDRRAAELILETWCASASD